VLEEVAKVGDESIVSWQPHGKAFRVHRPDLFARTVMPRYFKQTKYKSFLRQLHIYGFRRMGKSIKDRGAYFHSMFIRDKISMSLQMACQKIKGNEKTSNAVRHRAAADPDFYSSETTEVGNYQNQVYAPFNKEMQRGYSKRGPTTAFTTARNVSDKHPQEEDLLLNSALLFLNEEVTGGPSPLLLGSEIRINVDWMEQAKTILSRDEAPASPSYHHGCDSAAYEKGHAVWTLLLGVNHQKHCDEGFFAGKRFFHVLETKMPSPLSIKEEGKLCTC
jgi:hypothetical protein